MKTIECHAEVAIQGDEVLSFINCTQERGIYEVIGFEEPRVTIIDYRQQGVDAIHRLLKTKGFAEFAPAFNTPALVTIQEEDDGSVLIELNESNVGKPDKMLWIPIGIQDSIPVYKYLFERVAPLTDDTFAFIALFEIPGLGQQYSDGWAFHNQTQEDHLLHQSQ